MELISSKCGLVVHRSGPATADGLRPRNNFSTPGEVMEKLKQGMVGYTGDDPFSGMVVVSSFVNTDLK